MLINNTHICNSLAKRRPNFSFQTFVGSPTRLRCFRFFVNWEVAATEKVFRRAMAEVWNLGAWAVMATVYAAGRIARFLSLVRAGKLYH